MKQLLLLLLLAFFTGANAQLSNFNIQVNKIDETCQGNGSLTITTSNTTPLSSLLYKVYKLPNVTQPISILTTGYVSSLSSGTYKVLVIQALGSLSNSVQQEVVINNNIAPFNYTVGSSNQNCSAGGNIIITTTSGIGGSYEIISGPVTRPLQSSNVFQALPGGTYNIRAYNNCGAAKVKTYTLSLINSILSISDPSYSEAGAVLCDSITVNNTITPSAGSISYPLTVQHTLNPMNMSGESIVINQTFTTGDPDSLTVSAVVPRPLTESYSFELRVTDNCNTVYEKLDNEVDPDIKLALTPGSLLCANKYLIVSASKHMAPYTVEFVSAPEGFTASAFNSLGGGPFTDNSVEFGGEGNPVPFGTYVVQITDACGRIAVEEILIEFVALVPNVRANNNGCFSEFGRIRINIAQQVLTSAIIIAAPSTYTQALPQNVTSNINESGMLVLLNMPLGVYTIKFTDDCGFEYMVDVDVPPFVEKDFNTATLPDCTPGRGTVRVRSGNGNLTSVIITSAPAAFGQSLPLDMTSLINAGGDFYMNDLPSGTYTFKATDICGIVKDKSINVEGYMPPQNSFVFTPNCGTFSVKVTDSSNGTEGASYWLQKYNPATGAWMYPGNSELVYEEGTVPTTSNSVKLNNNATRNNLGFIGKFRIIKKFESFGNGTEENTICLSVLGEFIYTDAFAISNAYSLACTGSPNDVYIEAVGYIVSYKIEKKNGSPFVVDNGPNHIFTNLDSAVYIFSIEDACGNKLVKEFNLAELPSIADATKPTDMHICVAPDSVQNNIFHLTDQNAAILGTMPAAMYTITYHLTQEDADGGINALPEYYTNTANGQIIFARVVNNHIALCHGTTSFGLYIGEFQEPRIITEGTICNDGKLALTADSVYSSYLWSTGETTRTIYVTEPGTYTLIVEKAYGDRVCDGVTELVIEASSAPTITKVDTKDWTRNENMITVYTEGIGTYEYSIDGINFQESNVFENLECGAYKVTVKDANGCGTAVKEVVLLHYPNFFTPNGDGTHDKWQIKYSILEPHMKIDLFDRYGKHITSFGSTSEGWDGTLNGLQLPSTDYWFVVTREDGRELRGHFAMLR